MSLSFLVFAVNVEIQDLESSMLVKSFIEPRIIASARFFFDSFVSLLGGEKVC